jgi:hypothetical protein
MSDETQPNVIAIGPENFKVCDAFVVIQFNLNGGMVESTMTIYAHPGLPPRETLLQAFEPIADKILTSDNCGCDRCQSAHRTANMIKAVIQKEDAILAGEKAN